MPSSGRRSSYLRRMSAERRLVIAAGGVFLLMLAFAEWVILRGNGVLGEATLGLALALVAIALMRFGPYSPPSRESRLPSDGAEIVLLSSRRKSDKSRVSKRLNEPISPELVLVDPELARIAREGLL